MLRERSDLRPQTTVQTPVTLWFTGFSGAGKTTIAEALHRAYRKLAIRAQLLDGDTLRTGLNRDLGFCREDRQENLRRIAEVAKLFNQAGLFVTVATISPCQADRDTARAIIGADRFLEIHVSTPLQSCEERDPKGLYARARAGLVPEFTGVSAPYEPPRAPDLCLSGVDCQVQDNVHSLLDLLQCRGFLTAIQLKRVSSAQVISHAC